MEPGSSAKERPNLTDITKSLTPGSVITNSSGYARLQGCGRGALDFLVRARRVILGRQGGGAHCEMKTTSRKVGRRHALLAWDDKNRRWTITCLSRKGALVVDGIPVVRGAPPTVLYSRSLVEIGDTFFYFLLPRVPIARTKDLAVFEEQLEEERRELRRRAEERLKNAKKASEQKRKLTVKIKAPKKRPKPAVPKIKTEDDNAGNDASQVRLVAPKAVLKEEYKKDWTKKEKADFLRAINAVGVNELSPDAEGHPHFDWRKFRSVSPLPRKSDEYITEYYLSWIADVEAVLANEEKEKRMKGPRTKHKPGCDCIVCENTRKSRQKLFDEANGESVRKPEQQATLMKPKRLVGLVTAQKFKKRMAILEAAANIDSPAGESVIAKLSAQPAGSGAGGVLPIWWENGKHDRAMMIGCSKYGVGQWKTLWASDLFADVRGDSSGDHAWPSEKTAMKRLREVSSAVNTLIRREQKRLKRKNELEAEGVPNKKRKIATKKRLLKKKDSRPDATEIRNLDVNKGNNKLDIEADEREADHDEDHQDRFVEYYNEEADGSGDETEDEEDSDEGGVEEETVELTEDDLD